MKQQMDMDVMDFARKISMLTKHTPVADQFDMGNMDKETTDGGLARESI